MFKNKKLFAVMLAVLLVFSSAGAVFAAWPSFQNDTSNNGVITGTAPHTTASPSVTTLDTLNSAPWSGIDVSPVIDSSNNAYVLYSGADDTRLAKVNLNSNSSFDTTGAWAGTGNTKRGVQVSTTSAFQLSTPAISGSNIYVAGTNFVQKLATTTFAGTNGSAPTGWTSNVVSGTPNYNYTDVSGFMKLTGATGVNELELTQTFEGISGRGLRIEGDVLGFNILTGGTFEVFLNGSSTPLCSYDLSQSVGYSINVNVSSSALVTGTNTIKLVFTYEAEMVKPGGYVQIGNFRLFHEDSSLMKFALSDGTKTVLVESVPGQINTPITIANGNIYFGTYHADGGKYYQYRTATSDLVTFDPGSSSESFYWAGAAVVGNYVVFGGDSGTLYKRSVANFGTSGTSVAVSSTAKIRSSVCVKQNGSYYYLYFTTNDGYVKCYRMNSSGTISSRWSASLEGTSTSTPVVSANNKLYVGSNGKVKCFTNIYSSAASQSWSYTAAGPVQSSPIVYTSGTTDYIYYTVNSASGAGYCITNTGSTPTATTWSVSSTGSNTRYILQGMACSDNGYLVFGDDSATIYIVEP